MPLGLHGQLMVYKRVFEENVVLVAVNFGKEKAHYKSAEDLGGQIILAIDKAQEGGKIKDSIELEAEQAIVVKLK